MDNNSLAIGDILILHNDDIVKLRAKELMYKELETDYLSKSGTRTIYDVNDIKTVIKTDLTDPEEIKKQFPEWFI